MKRVLGQFVLICTLAFTTACAAVRAPVPQGEIPQARQLQIEDEQYGQSVLHALTEKYELDYNDPRLDTIIEIVDNITIAAGAAQDPWHVYLFREPKIKNAAATRGNHVFVWSGLLDVASSDDEIATILAHEVAHVLAGHTDPDPNEFVKQLLISTAAVAAGMAISATTSNPTTAQSLGKITASLTQEIGSGFLLYPYSREREREADQVGLYLMADAKYDPEKAVEFWNKVTAIPDFQSTIEFFSTHPVPEDRKAFLESMLPDAKARYLAAKAGQPRPKSVTPQYKGTYDKPPTAQPGDGFSWD